MRPVSHMSPSFWFTSSPRGAPQTLLFHSKRPCARYDSNHKISSSIQGLRNLESLEKLHFGQCVDHQLLPTSHLERIQCEVVPGRFHLSEKYQVVMWTPEPSIREKQPNGRVFLEKRSNLFFYSVHGVTHSGSTFGIKTWVPATHQLPAGCYRLRSSNAFVNLRSCRNSSY